MENKPLPGCKAILLCERTMIEAGTRKISLMALIDTLAFPSFPARTKLMKLFLHLIEGIGDCHLHVEVHDLAEDEVSFKSQPVKIAFTDRLAQRRLIFSLRGLPIPHAGKYDVIVFGDGAEIDRTQITAIPVASGDTP